MVILGRQLKNELEPNGSGRRGRMTRLFCLLRDYTTQQPRTRRDPTRPATTVYPPLPQNHADRFRVGFEKHGISPRKRGGIERETATTSQHKLAVETGHAVIPPSQQHVERQKPIWECRLPWPLSPDWREATYAFHTVPQLHRGVSNNPHPNSALWIWWGRWGRPCCRFQAGPGWLRGTGAAIGRCRICSDPGHWRIGVRMGAVSRREVELPPLAMSEPPNPTHCPEPSMVSATRQLIAIRPSAT